MEAYILRNILCIVTILILLILVADNSFCLDIFKLPDQAALRCPGGRVALGDSEMDVRHRCGDPLKIAAGQDFGPVWIYHFRRDRVMFYLAFSNANLQRIARAPCHPSRADCLDIR